VPHHQDGVQEKQPRRIPVMSRAYPLDRLFQGLFRRLGFMRSRAQTNQDTACRLTYASDLETTRGPLRGSLNSSIIHAFGSLITLICNDADSSYPFPHENPNGEKDQLMLNVRPGQMMKRWNDVAERKILHV